MTDNPNMHRFAHEAMTTTFDAIIIHDDRAYAGQAATAVFDEINRMERLLSRFDPGTDLAQVNRLRPGEWMTVNLEIVECLEVAARAFLATGGAFDAAYRSTRNGSRPSAMNFLLLSRPDSDAPDEPSDFLVGIAPEAAEFEFGSDMTIPLDARKLIQDKPADPTPPDSANFDLGAIGKGYALDRCIEILGDWEIENFLLNSGTSTVLARGAGPDAQGWPVGVSGDYMDVTGVEKTLLNNQALSGSGTALKGEHIRVPVTGDAAPAIAAWAKTESAAWSDALSTALMVMPRETLEKFCGDNSDLAAIVIYPEGETVKALVKGNWV